MIAICCTYPTEICCTSSRNCLIVDSNKIVNGFVWPIEISTSLNWTRCEIDCAIVLLDGLYSYVYSRRLCRSIRVSLESADVDLARPRYRNRFSALWPDSGSSLVVEGAVVRADVQFHCFDRSAETCHPNCCWSQTWLALFARWK